ncbi:MAG: GspE/PulE family protein, partial [Planctomycetota bacterium]
LVCFRTRASDIHIEPKSEHTLVRVRIDGTMVDIAKLKADVGNRLATVVKVLCDIDLHGKNIVQEGSFAAKVPDRRVDYRVSFSPSVSGQKLVIRVLDEANAPRYMWELGLPEPVFKALDKSMKRDAGTVIVCGPTGSGKTATLYATLRSIDQNERNVVTIEDPVEIRLEGITQMPVDEEKGNTFAELLRSTLRQDPDVILVGEIRDSETATTAIQAAMTGHLVFSTIHARDTVGSIFRLQDLGVEPYALANGLQNLIAQRLVRKLCPHCKIAKPLSDDDKETLGEKAAGITTIYKEHGCRRCLGTGFSGRCGVYELLTVTDDVRDAIASGAGQAAVLEALRSTKFRRLRDAGNDLVLEGITTLDEIDRVLGS